MAGGGAVVATAAAGGWFLLPGSETLSGPPRIDYGKEPCDQCGMIISDERFAGARREGDSKEQHFDDIGCLVVASRALPKGPNIAYFVFDFESDGWLDAPMAAYVTAPNIKSPMSYQLGAFPSKQSADSFAQKYSGEVTTWEALLADLKERG